MKFKEWLLDESVQLVKQYSSVEGVIPIYLGKFGRFVVTYFYKKGNENRSEIVKQEMIKCGDEANYRLSSLGFPKNKVATVITDKDVRLEGELEAAAGLAYFAPHGMMVRYENIEAQIFTDVLVHEYSHMYWKNMPKEAKKLFIEKYKYYRSNFNDEDYLKYISQQDKDSYIQKIINFGMQGLDTQSLANTIISDLKNIFHVNKNENIVDEILLPENKTKVIQSIESSMVNYFNWNDYPTSAGGYTYMMGNTDLPYFARELINPKDLYDSIYKNHNTYKLINQQEDDLNSYINKNILDRLCDKPKIEDLVNREIKIKDPYDDRLNFDSERAAMAKKFNLPSYYSASNVDELWAVTVDYVTQKKKITPELRKLLIQTIMMSR